MKYSFFLIFLFTSVCTSANTDDPVQAFNLGNEAYKSGAYDSARIHYTKVLELGLHSAEVYYNLGNAYFKTGNIPAAILYYEKSKRMDPSNPDVSYNLNVSNALISDKIPAVDMFFMVQWWQALAGTNSADQWGVIFLVILSLTLTGLGLFLFSVSAQLKQILFFVILMNGLITLFTVALAIKAHRMESKSYAIVFSPTVNARSEPSAGSAVQFVIHEGLKVETLSQEGDWTLIQLADGKSGWIPLNAIESI